MNARQLIEELKKFTEEDFIEDEMVDEFETPAITDSNLTDTTNLADELDAKTKIARALEVLKKAVDDFKTATVTEVDLINDSTLMSTIEAIDQEIKTIESSLSGKAEPIAEPMDMPMDTPMEMDSEQTSDEDSDLDEIDFDDEASLDFFSDEDEESEDEEDEEETEE